MTKIDESKYKVSDTRKFVEKKKKERELLIQNTIYDKTFKCPICDLLNQKKDPSQYAVNPSILCKEHTEMYERLTKISISTLD